MKYLFLSVVFLLIASPVNAASVTANETLKRGSIITAADINIKPAEGEVREDIMRSYLGKELKRTIYAGYKINPAYVGEPIVVKRNERVNMVYRFGNMEISAWGRALDEGSTDDIITIMNLESRKKVQGRILASGIIEVRS